MYILNRVVSYPGDRWGSCTFCFKPQIWVHLIHLSMCIEFFESRLINIESKEKIAQLKLWSQITRTIFSYFIIITLPCFSTCVNEEFTLTCLSSLYWISLYNGLVSRAGKSWRSLGSICSLNRDFKSQLVKLIIANQSILGFRKYINTHLLEFDSGIYLYNNTTYMSVIFLCSTCWIRKILCILPLQTSNHLDYLKKIIVRRVPFRWIFPWNCWLFTGNWVVQYATFDFKLKRHPQPVSFMIIE